MNTFTKDSTPHSTLRYEAVLRILEGEGWKRQEIRWLPDQRVKMTEDPTHRIEWFNRGTDLLTVYVDSGGETCIVFVPVTLKTALKVIRRVKRRVDKPHDDARVRQALGDQTGVDNEPT